MAEVWAITRNRQIEPTRRLLIPQLLEVEQQIIRCPRDKSFLPGIYSFLSLSVYSSLYDDGYIVCLP